MNRVKQTILITGTPCVGKTTVSKRLAAELDALYVNLTELAERENLCSGRDEERNTTIISEAKMRNELKRVIELTEKSFIIIDGHYAASVTPKNVVTKIFVLRRNPVELRKLMEKNGFEGTKLWENLASEILDTCLIEALKAHEEQKVCEIDATKKSVEEITHEILSILHNEKKCGRGHIDWIGLLENQGILSDYLLL